MQFGVRRLALLLVVSGPLHVPNSDVRAEQPIPDLASAVGEPDTLNIPEATVLPTPVQESPPPSILHFDSLFDAARESLFGDAYAKPSSWHPLSLEALFSEGWDEAYANAPAGTGGAPRHGWINSFDGNFFRAWFFVFAYQNELNHNGSGYIGSYDIYLPVNRRLEFRVEVPFVLSNRAATEKRTTDNRYHTNFGDLTLATRLLLSETQNSTQVISLPVRMPTGNWVNDSGVSSLSPQYQFWVNPFRNWAVRGGTGVTVPTNTLGGRTQYIANLAAGRYWTGKDDGWIHHFWLYVAANLSTPIAGSGSSASYLGITPGMRVQITGLWFFMAGVEIPVLTPQEFAYSPIFLLLKDY